VVSDKPKPGSSLVDINPDVARQAHGWNPAVLAVRGGCWFRGGGLEVHLGLRRTLLLLKRRTQVY